MVEPTLFDAPATRGSSRRSDPATSRDAGRSISGPVLRDQQRHVLNFASRFRTFTAWEVWKANHDDALCPKENVISKRLGELVDLRMIRDTADTRPGSSCRQQKVYALTPMGSAWVEGRPT